MFYRHGRYFVFHLFARRNRALLENTTLQLSNDDQILLSRIITELAELIFTRAEAKFAVTNKGYLAVFRSLTDCKDLATDAMLLLTNPPAVATITAAATAQIPPVSVAVSPLLSPPPAP
jgi:hypothetical protein